MDTEPLAQSPETYPADTWLRHVTFPDPQPDTGEDAPVHVAAMAPLFNGAVAKPVIGRYPITVDAGPLQGTVVSFVVLAEDAERPTKDTPARIGSLHVLAPVDTDDPERWKWKPFTTEGGDLVRVYILVRTLTFGTRDE